MDRIVHAIGRMALAIGFLVLATAGTGCDGGGTAPTPPNVPQLPPAPPTPPLPPGPHLMANPCTGTLVLTTLPRLDETQIWIAGPPALVTLEMEFTLGSERVTFDWLGPYDGDNEVHGDHPDNLHVSTAEFEVALMDWTTNTAAGAVRHAMTFAWPAGELPGLEAGIRFHADDGACPGEPSVVCTEAGCELRSGNDEFTGTALRRR